MNLSDYELLPGVVVSVKDEEHLGRIKASVPGGESPSNTQIEAMPWVYPMFMTGTYQGFTKLLEGSKIWVMRNKLDKLEMWYWPMVDLNPNTQEIVDTYDNTDVLISRDCGGNNVYIYYTDGQGIVLSVGPSKITIDNIGSIILTTGKGQIKIVGENVFLNTDTTSDNHATKCEPLTSCLEQIKDCLTAINTACQHNYLVSNVYTLLNPKLSALSDSIKTKSWQSNHVHVN